MGKCQRCHHTADRHDRYGCWGCHAQYITANVWYDGACLDKTYVGMVRLSGAPPLDFRVDM